MTVVPLGEREPKGRETIRKGVNNASETEEFVVQRIVGRREAKVKIFFFFFF